MNVLIVGGGPSSGASCMRAEQLGRAIGAHVHVDPWHDPQVDFQRVQFVIIVKRLKKRWKRWIARVQHARKPIVWDAVDFWHQPEENDLDRRLALKSFWRRHGELGPKLAIMATKAMARDCGGVYLPHHHRVGLSATPVRRTVEVVAYEGNETYLAHWRAIVDDECARRGWRFALNPPQLTDADIVVALRGDVWDGWTCRQWKSGVKYANSIAAGRPIISQRCAAFDEMQPPGTVIETRDDLARAFDQWTDYDARLAAASTAEHLVPQYHLARIADDYQRILREHMRDYCR